MRGGPGLPMEPVTTVAKAMLVAVTVAVAIAIAFPHFDGAKPSDPFGASVREMAGTSRESTTLWDHLTGAG